MPSCRSSTRSLSPPLGRRGSRQAKAAARRRDDRRLTAPLTLIRVETATAWNQLLRGVLPRADGERCRCWLTVPRLPGPDVSRRPGARSDTDHGAQIFTVRPNGRHLRQITHVSGDAINADWSPDGRLIAFDIETPDAAQLAIMNADGSGLVALPRAPGNVFEGDPSFTPDGRRIVFGTFNGEVEGLWSMKLDGTDRRLIKTGAAVDPNVSPDGRRVAFMDSNGEPFGQALFTIATNGS